MPLDQIDIEDDSQLPDEYKGNLPNNVPSSGEMSFIEHLDVLRKHLFRSTVFVLICSIGVGFFISFFLDHVILAPTKQDFITFELFCKISKLMGNELLCMSVGEQEAFINTKLGGQFTMHITLSFTIGVILSFPFLIFQVWQFIKPALYSNEQKTASGVVFFCSLLFFMGVAFSYYLVLPLTYNFLINYTIADEGSIKNTIFVSSYMSTFVDLNLACGIMFQLPMFIYILSKLGIVRPELLLTYRKHAIVIIFVLAAVLTPADVLSMILVALPLLLLYQVSISISKRVEKNRIKESLT